VTADRIRTANLCLRSNADEALHVRFSNCIDTVRESNVMNDKKTTRYELMQSDVSYDCYNSYLFSSVCP
jgi:hypothetical protein